MHSDNVFGAEPPRFECPFCGNEHRVNIDWFVWDELWEGLEGYACDECGREFDLNGHIEIEY